MDALRKIINSNELASVVDIPASLRNMQVELIILPIGEHAQKRGQKSAYGILKQYANPNLMASEAGAWEQAVMEKYALR